MRKGRLLPTLFAVCALVLASMSRSAAITDCVGCADPVMLAVIEWEALTGPFNLLKGEGTDVPVPIETISALPRKQARWRMAGPVFGMITDETRLRVIMNGEEVTKEQLLDNAKGWQGRTATVIVRSSCTSKGKETSCRLVEGMIFFHDRLGVAHK